MKIKLYLAWLLTLATAAAQASSLPSHPFIHATGSAVLEIAPDVAEIEFELRVLSADPQHSLDMLEQDSAQVLAFLTEHQVTSTDIDAYAVRKIVSQDESMANAQTPKTYRLLRSFHVYVRNLQQWATLSNGLLQRESLGNFTVTFGRSDLEKINHELVLQAAANARLNASRLATGFAVRLGAASAIAQVPLKTVSSLIGLEGSRPGAANGEINQPTTRDLALPHALRYQQNLDVIFRIK